MMPKKNRIKEFDHEENSYLLPCVSFRFPERPTLYADLLQVTIEGSLNSPTAGEDVLVIQNDSRVIFTFTLDPNQGISVNTEFIHHKRSI